MCGSRAVLFASVTLLVGCGGEESDGPSKIPVADVPASSTAEQPPTAPDFTAEPGGTAPPPPPGEPSAHPSGAPTGSTPPVPEAPPDDRACGGCTSDALLRCDPVTLRCVECLTAADCAYGSQQACIQGWCTNVNPAVTPCPETRATAGASCGFSGYTCVWGTAGKYSCDCGLGAPIMGGGPIEATVWTCGVLP